MFFTFFWKTRRHLVTFLVKYWTSQNNIRKYQWSLMWQIIRRQLLWYYTEPKGMVILFFKCILIYNYLYWFVIIHLKKKPVNFEVFLFQIIMRNSSDSCFDITAHLQTHPVFASWHITRMTRQDNVSIISLWQLEYLVWHAILIIFNIKQIEMYFNRIDVCSYKPVIYQHYLGRRLTISKIIFYCCFQWF